MITCHIHIESKKSDSLSKLIGNQENELVKQDVRRRKEDKSLGLAGVKEGEKRKEIPPAGMTFCIFQEVSGVWGEERFGIRSERKQEGEKIRSSEEKEGDYRNGIILFFGVLLMLVIANTCTV